MGNPPSLFLPLEPPPRADRCKAYPHQTHTKPIPCSSQVDDYYECSSSLLQAINLIDEDKNPTAGFTGLTMMWELRHIIPQALVLTKCLPRLMEEFVVGKSMDHAERETVQVWRRRSKPILLSPRLARAYSSSNICWRGTFVSGHSNPIRC